MPEGKWRHVERQMQRARVTGLRLFSNTFVIRTTRVCTSCLFITCQIYFSAFGIGVCAAIIAWSRGLGLGKLLLMGMCL